MKNYYIWFEQLNKTSDGNVGQNESPEKIKFLFLSNIVFQCSLRMHHWIFSQNIAREHFYSQTN